MNTFIDEAGNTGSDLKQEKQPFFVLSAITLAETNMKIVLDELELQFANNKEKEEVEIKAAKWSKSAKKAKALQSIIEKFVTSGGHISVVIIEKRYMISAMIVDNFFDPIYNDIKDYKWLNDTDEKIKAVNYFYSKLTDDIIYKLWSSIQNLNENELRKILDDTAKAIDNKEYIDLLHGANSHIPELINGLDLTEYANRNGFNNSAIRSPNYTAFPCVMNPVILHCRALQKKTSIVFDNAVEFNHSYEHIYSIFSRMNIDIPTPNGVMYSWKDVEKFCIAKSEDEKGLQIADIVSSSVNQLMMKTLSGAKISNYDLFNAALLMLLDREYKSVWYVVSTPFYKKYFDMQLNESSKLN
ncbi:hypothetical protein M2138_002094 [Dysgonomonadaceae bacterium PH5-43]|nr:hypothetical protein [Dysgonomonadaceae bacterium PH5-43]